MNYTTRGKFLHLLLSDATLPASAQSFPRPIQTASWSYMVCTNCQPITTTIPSGRPVYPVMSQLWTTELNIGTRLVMFRHFQALFTHTHTQSLCPSATEHELLNRFRVFIKFDIEDFTKRCLASRNVVIVGLSDCYPLLTGLNKFPPVVSIFVGRYR